MAIRAEQLKIASQVLLPVEADPRWPGEHVMVIALGNLAVQVPRPFMSAPKPLELKLTLQLPAGTFGPQGF